MILLLESYLLGIGTGATFTVVAFSVATVRRLSKAPDK